MGCVSSCQESISTKKVKFCQKCHLRGLVPTATNFQFLTYILSYLLIYLILSPTFHIISCTSTSVVCFKLAGRLRYQHHLFAHNIQINLLTWQYMSRTDKAIKLLQLP